MGGRNLHFFIHYFIDSNIKKPEKVIDKLSKFKLLKTYYLVCFINGSDRLEIISTTLFKEKYFKEQKYEIVVLAQSEECAFEFVRQLSEVSVRKYGSFYARKCLEEIEDGEINI